MREKEEEIHQLEVAKKEQVGKGREGGREKEKLKQGKRGKRGVKEFFLTFFFPLSFLPHPLLFLLFSFLRQIGASKRENKNRK